MCGTVLKLRLDRLITLTTLTLNAFQENQMDAKPNKLLGHLAAVAAVLALSACASPNRAPATADVAVSRNAVDNAVSAGAAQLAPEEINAARAKMMAANQALAAKDYKLASQLATQAQADAQLAQSKANSAKATAASQALNEDLRVLRQEVDRANTPAQ
jgi:N-acyl-D-aspartate/D-glutamate deacylase